MLHGCCWCIWCILSYSDTTDDLGSLLFCLEARIGINSDCADCFETSSSRCGLLDFCPPLRRAASTKGRQGGHFGLATVCGVLIGCRSMGVGSLAKAVVIFIWLKPLENLRHLIKDLFRKYNTRFLLVILIKKKRSAVTYQFVNLKYCGMRES